MIGNTGGYGIVSRTTVTQVTAALPPPLHAGIKE